MVIGNRADVLGLRRANRATAKLLKQLARMSRPGVTTRELDDYARAYIARLGGVAVFASEENFPGAINTSVNDAVLHGVPGDYALQPGDLLKIDAGMELMGYCGDSCVTVAVGEIAPAHRRLMDAARGTMEAGIAAAVVGNRVGDIGAAMQRYAEGRGYGVVRGFTGHGVGHTMHEDPQVPFVGRAGTGVPLVDGLVITIEPCITEFSPEVHYDTDKWTVRTDDGGYAAQFEHTVIVGTGKATILSLD